MPGVPVNTVTLITLIALAPLPVSSAGALYIVATKPIHAVDKWILVGSVFAVVFYAVIAASGNLKLELPISQKKLEIFLGFLPAVLSTTFLVRKSEAGYNSSLSLFYSLAGWSILPAAVFFGLLFFAFLLLGGGKP